jgi:hypothetical protein
MSNKRNAGRKSKFQEGTQTKILHKLIPIEAEEQIKQLINKTIEKWIRK